MDKKYNYKEVYNMSQVNEIFGLISPIELLIKADKDFTVRDGFFIIEESGEIKSFESLESAEKYLEVNSIIETLKDYDEPGVMISLETGRILKAGDRDALVYYLDNFKGENPAIVKLPNDNSFIENIIKQSWMLMDFHQLTMDLFD